ncbi:WD repeat-containing protein 18 isoform X1 [Festucalex cinctus]
MAAPLEVVVSSDASSQLWNVSVFDVHSGSSLLSYRGGNSSARTLCLLNGQYLLSAQLAKNFINVWEIHRKEQLQQKIVCPGVVTCISASADGVFLAAGVAEAVYLWEVSTGKLLSVVTRHYQDVTCVKFTDDGSHFVSGGKDSVVLVWSLSSVIQVDLSHAPEPRHILSRHSLPITDLHCGMMGAQARVATASLDQTVKLWEVSSGELLLSVLFDAEIMSVTLDPCEHFLFCGASDGNIFQVPLCNQGAAAAAAEKSLQCDADGKRTFKGHRKMVTCLSVSMDGTLLVSGSHDESVRVWDVQSKQCVRCFAHKGAPSRPSAPNNRSRLFSLWRTMARSRSGDKRHHRGGSRQHVPPRLATLRPPAALQPPPAGERRRTVGRRVRPPRTPRSGGGAGLPAESRQVELLVEPRERAVACGRRRRLRQSARGRAGGGSSNAEESQQRSVRLLQPAADQSHVKPIPVYLIAANKNVVALHFLSLDSRLRSSGRAGARPPFSKQ